ncbi:hypothetical protein, partial [Salmonella enterica]|uniref:hypothetical protein n=1 Tax=Salmonella enterica TaxID=28901 RepID=UPI002158571D
FWCGLSGAPGCVTWELILDGYSESSYSATPRFAAARLPWFTASTEESLKKHREGVKEAMMQHRKDMLKLAGNTGMMLLGIVFLLFTASGGTLWYLGGRIQANLEDIRKQEETLQKLNAKTWGVEFVQDGNRKFLVLPCGKSAEVIPFQGKEWVHLKE